MNANILQLYCFDNGISHHLPFFCLISASLPITVQNANTMNSFPRHNRKIITEDRKVRVWKGGEKAGILAREQNRMTLLEKRSMKGRIQGNARHTALWVLVRMGKHCVSAIKRAEIEGIFSSWQDGRLNASTVIFDIKNLWDWKILETCNDKVRKSSAEQRPFDKEGTW